MTEAITAAWGTDGGVCACAREALLDFQRCDAEGPPCSPESLLALHRRALELHRYTVDVPPGALWEELGYRLFTFYSDSPNAENYLVRGLFFRSNLDGEWEPEFPSCEVDPSFHSWGSGVVRVTFPSAF